MTKRKITVILVDRANYGRLKPVMAAIQAHPDLELQVVCSGTMVLERFGSPANAVEKDGFPVTSRLYIELEGSVPATMAKSLGFAVIEFANEFQRLQSDIILIIGDRYEAFAAGIAASFMNLCVAHVQGGEVSGSIDESTRHCLTKLAHYHFPATKRSAEYIARMGERPETIFHVGCPSGDIAFSLDKTLPEGIFQKGVGGELDPSKPYILVVFHPTTTEFGHEKQEAETLLEVVDGLGHQVLWLWPNIDAGADHVSKAIRTYRELKGFEKLRLVKNYPPDVYHKILANAACAVGNSSSFVRDASFFGTPVVMVGDRQKGREVAEHLRHCEIEKSALTRAISEQIAHGRYAPSTLYGEGNASRQIAEHLARVPLYVQKTLGYMA